MIDAISSHVAPLTAAELLVVARKDTHYVMLRSKHMSDQNGKIELKATFADTLRTTKYDAIGIKTTWMDCDKVMHRDSMNISLIR